jgi:hypothetical protein
VGFDEIEQLLRRRLTDRLPHGRGELVGSSFEVEPEGSAGVTQPPVDREPASFETGPRSCDRLIVATSAAGDPLLTAVLVDIDHRRVEQARLDVVDPLACEQRPVVVTA